MENNNRPSLDDVLGGGELLRQFPLLAEKHYLNHAAISPWPAAASEAVQQFAAQNSAHGAAAYDQWLDDIAQLRQRLAALVGAAGVDDIALLPNTSYGINLVASGLAWQAGDNVVLPRNEFPSMEMPWQALGARGVSLRYADLAAAESPEDALLALVDERTRLLALSSVQWTDGLRLDIARIGAACRARGVLLFVDAIQQLGALRVDVVSSQVDFLAAGCHKWQMGPEGIAVFYCHPAAREQIRPLALGWRMLDDPYQFDRPGRPVSASARRFEPGTANTMGQLALNASVGLLEQVGMARVEARVLANTRQLTSGLQGMPGVQVASPVQAARQSGIVSIAVAAHDHQQLWAQLAEHGIITVCRGPYLRFSPHFYQGSTQIEAALDVLERCL
jgi:selenocysteine lyase/cysteine desulfurase